LYNNNKRGKDRYIQDVTSLQRKNQIKSNQIKSNQIKSNQIKSNQIKSNQIKSNQIKSNQRPLSLDVGFFPSEFFPLYVFYVSRLIELNIFDLICFGLISSLINLLLN